MAANSRVRHVARFPETFLALRLSPKIQPEAVQWLVHKITGSKKTGGAELLVRCEPFHMRKGESIVLHVTARPAGFLENAEYLEMKKLDVHGNLRDFVVKDLDWFLQGGNRNGDEDETSILTPAEKQIIVRHGLKNIRAAEGETYIPGYPEFSLYTGQPVLQAYLRRGLITEFFPLHNQEALAKFRKTWYSNFHICQGPPIAAIRHYFGDVITLYYTAAGAYTDSLLIPLLVSTLVWLLSWLSDTAAAYGHLIHCIFNVVWVTTCLEIWKQRSAILAFNWGTLRMFRMEEPRLYFSGSLVPDPITLRLQRRYPRWKRNAKVIFSWCIVLACLAGALYVLFESIRWKDHAGDENYGANVLSLVFVLIIRVMKYCFKKLATFLTDWENHRTDSKYEFHRVTKLVCFELVNNFFSLFYMAFYIQDFEMLKIQIRTLLATHAFVQVLFPFILERLQRIQAWFLRLFKSVKDNEFSEVWRHWPLNRIGIHALDSNDSRIATFDREVLLLPFQDTFDDYLEMWVQFGYVYFFSPIYPMGVLWALISNIVELRTDAFKLCRWFQRPFAKRVGNIGAWQGAFEMMGIIAIFCNCGLLGLKLQEHMPAGLNQNKDNWLYFIVGFEHLLMIILLFLKFNISDIPSKIKIKFARQELESRKALRALQNAIRSGAYRQSLENESEAASEVSLQTIISQMGPPGNTSRSADVEEQEFFTPESGSASAVVILRNRRRPRDMAL